MGDNVVVGMQNTEVVCPDKDFFADLAKLAFEFGAMGHGGH